METINWHSFLNINTHSASSLGGIIRNIDKDLYIKNVYNGYDHRRKKQGPALRNSIHFTIKSYTHREVVYHIANKSL